MNASTQQGKSRVFFAMAACVLAALAFAREARGAIIGFDARVEQTTVAVGERIQYTIYVTADDRMPAAQPTTPDFGGLTVTYAPRRPSDRTQITNGVARFTRTYEYQLSAPAAGTYTIGPTEISIGDRRYPTKPITIKVTEHDLSALPPSLQSEPILHPMTNDRGINQELRGKIFVRPRVSNTEPYVGEPVVLSYDLYYEPRFEPLSPRPTEPQFEGMLAERDTSERSFRDETVDGYRYRVLPLYRAVLTPMGPGPVQLTGYSVQFRLPVRSRGRSRSRSMFDPFFESVFDQSIPVQAAAGPLQLNVRPLPSEGRPADFSGTVGSFTVRTEVDRESATEDDLIQLTLTIEGRGNAGLASAPQFPENEDFELFDRTQETEKWIDAEGLRGRKTIEYLLHARRAGLLHVPALEYTLFDPAAGQYKTFPLPGREIAIAAGRSPAFITTAGEGGSIAPSEIGPQLHFFKPVAAPRMKPPEPLLESPLFWIAHFAAFAIVGFCYYRARKREGADPAQVRRAAAWAALEKKLHRMRREAGEGRLEPAATALERALREYIADRFDLSADGLTREEIARLLGEAGLQGDRTRGFMEILEKCSRIQYAPKGSGEGDPAAWADEAKAILSEGLR